MTSIPRPPRTSSATTSSRQSTLLEAAQAAAISLALEDDDDDDESVSSTFIQAQAKELEKKSPMPRLSVMTLQRGEQRGQSQCCMPVSRSRSSTEDDEQISLQWSRAQAIASAINYLDSDDDSLESATRHKSPKIDDIFSQIHRGGTNPCQDSNCTCKTKNFSVTRRLPPSTFSLDSPPEKRRRHSTSSEFTFVQQRPSIKYSQGKAPRRVTRRRTLQSLELEVEENVLSGKDKQCNDEEERSVGNEELNVQEGQVLDDNTNTGSQVSSIAATRTPRSYKLHFICLVIAVTVVATVVALIAFTSQDTVNEYPIDMEEESSDSTEDTVVSSIKVPELICTEQVPGEGWGGVTCGPQAQGSGVCILVARAFLDQVQDADIALQNSGYCPLNIEKGIFTLDLAHSE